MSIINGLFIDSSAPSNLTYFWNYGSLLVLCLAIQIATGVILAMHYTAEINLAFISVEHIQRDVLYGWLIRYCHANGAAFFFFAVYIHMARGLYYGSYTRPRSVVWSVGVIIFFIMIATAFIGYVLPFSQMSYWAATVITNLMSAIPWIGTDLVEFIWGGFSVDNPTLTRFFSLHYLLPFVIAFLVIIHFIALQEAGSGNPTGLSGEVDKIPFHPYYIYKDIVGFVVFLVFFVIFVSYNPTFLLHSDHFIPANSLSTPTHIVPEIYFLAFYAVLRSIPNKLLGVLAMIGAILILLILPLVETSRIRGLRFRPIGKFFYWLFIFNFFLLTWIGQSVPEYPIEQIGQVATLYYFAYFTIIVPLTGLIENVLNETRG